MLTRFAFLMLAAFVLCPLSSAYAEGPSVIASDVIPSERAKNIVQVTPYIWAAGMKGDVSPFKRAPAIGVEKTFSDVMENLNLGGFLNIWGRSGRVVFSGDVMYIDTTDSRKVGPLPPLPAPVPQGLTLNGKIDTEQFMVALQGGYRVYDDADHRTLDLLIGGRFWHISNDVTVSAGSQSRSYGESFSWLDPLVSARGFVPVTEKLSIQAEAGIGGFGVGSDMTWSALGTVNYLITDSISASAGYKIMDVDYSDDGHVYDVRLSGPVFGLTWRF